MSKFGRPLSTPMRVPDYNQNNPKKSDYIKNRPFYQDGNQIKPLDEKFIPDSIARTEDVKSLINANGGNGSGGAVQADYNQNDSTKSDYIKGRPFYKERTLIVNEDLSNYEFDWYANPIVDIRADGLLQLELNEQGFATVNVEIEDNGTIYKGKGFFIGSSIFDNQAMYISLADGKFEFQEFYDGTLQMMVYEPTTLEGVVFRVYVDTVKKIDAEYLPPNSVPYLYGEEVLLGAVTLDGLKTGAYILHGYIDVTPGAWEHIPDFIDKPTFVNVINDGNGRVNVYWLDTDDYADDSVCVRTMTVVDGTLVADNAISLAELKDGVDAAVEVAMGATENVDGAFAEIVAIHEEIAAIQDAIATINDKIYS